MTIVKSFNVEDFQKLRSNFIERKQYKLLKIILQIYGIEITGKMSKTCKFLSKVHACLMFLMPIYLMSMCLMEYLDGALHVDLIIGFSMSTIFPIFIQRQLILTKCSFRQMLIHYRKAHVLLGKRSFNNKSRKAINLAVASIMLLTALLAAVSAFTLPTDISLKLYYSFYQDLEEDVIGISIRFCMNQLVFAYQYTFTCIISLMVGVFYYEFSEFIRRLHDNLRKEAKSLNQCDILPLAQLHTLLFKVSFDLAGVTSLLCFLLVSSQMTVMYCTLAYFMLASNGSPSLPQICESLVIVVLGPLSISGISLCSSRIQNQHEKLLKIVVLLKGKLTRQKNCDPEALQCLSMIQEEQLQTMSAAGIGKLKTEFILAMFGSLFTYSLLILNFKK